MAKRGEKAVSLGEKLRKQQYDAIWKEYCGFLDLTMQDYMKIQNRLMEEQIQLWSDCELGKSILKGRRPSGIDEFRRLVPLTTYEDYADMLLQKRSETLPEEHIRIILISGKRITRIFCLPSSRICFREIR